MYIIGGFIMLEIKNLTKKYDRVIFHNLNIEFPDVGFVLLDGENGCGKTTLFRLILGLETIDEGSIYYKNIRLDSKDDFKNFRRDKVISIMQDYALINHLSVKDNILLPTYIRTEKNHNINELIKKLDLEVNINRQCKYLSGGEKQKVAIARALLSEKEIILCDEVTSALDEKSAVKVLKLLKNKSKNHLVIVISHDERNVKKYADYIFSFTDNKMVKIKDKKRVIKTARISKYKRMDFKEKIRLSFKSLLNQKYRNLICVFSISLSIICGLISVSLSYSVNNNLNNSLDNYINYNMLKISKAEKSQIGNGSISFVKERRPQYDNLFEDLNKDFEITSNYENFLNRGNFYVNDIEVEENVLILPFYRLSDTLYKKYDEMASHFSYDQVFMNKKAYECLGNRFDFKIKTRIESVDKYFTYCGDNVFISINFIGEMVVEEFDFMQVPIIYYSYEAMKEYFSSISLENVSKLFKEEISLETRISDYSTDEEDISSYSYLVWGNYMKIDDVKKDLTSKGYEISSYPLEVYNNVMSLFDTCEIVLNVFITLSSIICAILIFVIMYSMILDRKKEIGIYSLLGIESKDINDILGFDSIFITLFVHIIVLFVFPIISKFLNILIAEILFLPNFLTPPPKILFQNDLMVIVFIIVLLITFSINQGVFSFLKKKKVIEMMR